VGAELKKTATRVWVTTAVAAVLLAYAPGDDLLHAQSVEKKIQKQQNELDRIKKKIDDHRNKSQKLGRQETAVLNKLKNLDKEIDLSRTFLRNLSEQEVLLSVHVDSLNSAINMHELALTENHARLGQRLRQLYKRDPKYRWEILLGSATIDQAVTRYKFLKIIAEQDAALVNDFRGRRQELVMETARLTETLADMATVHQEHEAETGQLEKNKDQREAMLKTIRTQKSQHARAIKDLEKAQEQVKDLLGMLEKRRLDREDQGYVGDIDFAGLKGTMKWPVKGKVIRGFGKIRHPKYGTVTFNNGIDIRAAGGTPIIAVAAGSVEFVDWIDAYGKCIILNHGGGYYTLYSHVATTFVAQGQTVADAEVIAEVGDTGSLDGYVCHFEIRQSKKALDPMKWLSRSKKTGAS